MDVGYIWVIYIIENGLKKSVDYLSKFNQITTGKERKVN